ncbi:MAG: hypothetical protein GXN96_06375 [Aquificae bacterium]|nr:hypothetical protein [Aquificota bacterium]
MRTESVFQWGLILLLAALLFFAFTGILVSFLVTALTPEGFAFLLGFIGAWVFANRLLFGYGSFLITADAILQDREVNREEIEKKTREPKERLEGLSLVSLMALWLQNLDYYRYAYYGLFTLLLILMLLSKFNLLGALIIGDYLEGAFWGAAVVTLFVFAFEITASYLLGKLEEKAA